MSKFSVDAPIRKVIKTFEFFGFNVVREGNHIAMLRENPDGTRTPLAMPNHPTIKKSTPRTIFTSTLQKSRMPQIRGVKDEIVAIYCEPLTIINKIY